MEADAVMSDAQVLLGMIAIGALGVAVLAGWRDLRRRRRRDLDAVGWIDWTLVQVFALIAAAISVYLVLRD
ncbi:hypothetical protein NS334_12055 [Sphingomonas endophytica]|uniref:Uncharacterized protein n=2 Tax=Sphingomonas endophytica TaxID=869719 RepID=A0A147I020_9SPHN|nr:hypothetical protein NS334_12055 [Sphingomonas endophytica]